MSENILEINNLSLCFPEINFHAINNSNFSIKQSSVLALVGESGSGKSLTALSLLGLEPSNAMIRGVIKFNGQYLLNNEEFIPCSTRKYPDLIRGIKISYIPQDPLSSLNPMYSIFDQLFEAVKVANVKITKEQTRLLCFELLDKVGIPDIDRVLTSYPHELSGGMRQRVMIAMAVINNPDLIIADEPTTALDVTVQANVLKLLKELKQTILFITHDLGVVAEIADEVVVMQKGNIVEQQDVFSLFESPSESYTKSLLEAVLSI